jgi:hypothetical protein
MSYPAIVLPPLALSSETPRQVERFRLPVSPISPWPALPGRLFDALRLAVGERLHAGARDRVEPYQACRWCTAAGRWCGEGRPISAGMAGMARTAGMAGMAGAAGMAEMAEMAEIKGTLDALPAHAGGPVPFLEDLAALALGHGLIPPLSLQIGRHADPYSAAERAAGVTRSLLQGLADLSAPSREGRIGWNGGSAAEPLPGIEISIFTRSPLLLRDLDLLLDLDQHHAVTVTVLIPAADPVPALRAELPQAARRFPHPAHPAHSAHPAHAALAAHPAMPAAPAHAGHGALSPCPAAPAASARADRALPAYPSVAARFDLVRALASNGIATRVLCTPFVPGVNNRVALLHRLFDQARRAGAFYVAAAPRHPALPASAFEERHLLPVFHRLRLEHGFPHAVAGRG